METAAGSSINGGIAIGKIRIFKTPDYVIDPVPSADPAIELARFEEARGKVQEQQNALYEKAAASAGEKSAEIFLFHAGLLDDDDLLDACRDFIKEHHTAEYAVKNGCAAIAQIFESMDDPNFKARSADVIDVGNAMLACLSGEDTDSFLVEEPCILAAEDIVPSDLMRIDKSMLLGLVARGGSANGHMAILARSMNLPALIGCAELDDEWDGKDAILDASHGYLYIEPDPETAARLTAEQKKEIKRAEMLAELKGKPSVTRDGISIKICANIGGPEDVEKVLANDAEGVGLFRSEFLYLESSVDPSEEVQFQAYKKVLEGLAPRQVVIRTCDIGADKTVDYLKLDREANPALGLRAIRICLTRKDFFKRQLRALLRASAFGNLAIMFPMITSVREVQAAKEILEECRQELEKEGTPVGPYEMGIMIETPAAVLTADELGEEVDFFSIGTNDLTQYTCAIDRQNAKLSPFLDTHHPAVLKEIQMTVEAGHRHNCWVGICGELGADLTLTETFLRMGVDELSVGAYSVLPLREKVRSLKGIRDEG